MYTLLFVISLIVFGYLMYVLIKFGHLMTFWQLFGLAFISMAASQKSFSILRIIYKKRLRQQRGTEKEIHHGFSPSLISGACDDR